jgi:hypothetical protein
MYRYVRGTGTRYRYRYRYEVQVRGTSTSTGFLRVIAGSKRFNARYACTLNACTLGTTAAGGHYHPAAQRGVFRH